MTDPQVLFCTWSTTYPGTYTDVSRASVGIVHSPLAVIIFVMYCYSKRSDLWPGLRSILVLVAPSHTRANGGNLLQQEHEGLTHLTRPYKYSRRGAQIPLSCSVSKAGGPFVIRVSRIRARTTTTAAAAAVDSPVLTRRLLQWRPSGRPDGSGPRPRGARRRGCRRRRAGGSIGRSPCSGRGRRG